MPHRVAVDIGGTFTDFCVFDEESRALETLKVLSRPDAPGAEILEGIRALETRHAIQPEGIVFFTHGTTVGVNTVIQRNGAKLALFVTQGFEDVLELARLKVPDPYDLFSRRPAPLAPRERVWGIAERLLKDGTVAQPLDTESLRHAVAGAQAAGAEAIVVAFLHSYADASHELAAREIIQAMAPEMSITLSSEVWPVIREYERTVTATVAGYVQRRVADYLTALEAALAEAGAPATPMIGKSSGGMMATELGKTDPISMLLSGTAAGVMGAADIAARIGAEDVLSFDVGGTSADVAVIRRASPAFGTGEYVGDFPIYVPTVSVSSIGEGGGSIAWVDEHGVLKVGPESAGSSPGPACYGRGGTRPTVTDAFAALGLLGAAELGYGAVSIDRRAAERALAPLAKALGVSVQEAAESVLRVAVSGMFLGVSKLLSRHGADPRHFALLAFGGAGPMTACLLAREIGVGQVIAPPTPG
ncbi:MAG: hydantoinase/oxoprolinase family protein, partial [Pseudomonadota bacterium]